MEFLSPWPGAEGQRSASMQLAQSGLRALQTLRPWSIRRCERRVHSVLREERHEVGFDFHRVGRLRQSEPAGEAADMGVDDDAFVHGEGVAEDDVGGLPADAGELHELRHAARDLAAVALDERPAEALERLGFVAEEAGGLDEGLEILERNLRVMGGGGTGRNSAGVTRLTRTSVHCAESTVAARSSRAFPWSSAQWLPG